jgi:hypothetical protein
VNRRTPHVLLVREQLEIFQGAIFVVAVLPPNAMTFCNWTVRGFPNAAMNEFPILVEGTFARTTDGNFYPQVAIAVLLDRSYREEVLRPLTALESGLFHTAAAARIAWPAQSLILRNMPFRKAIPATAFLQPLALFFVEHGYKCSALSDAELFRFSMNRTYVPPDDRR